MAKTMFMVSLCNDEGHISVNTHLRFIFLGQFHVLYFDDDIILYVFIFPIIILFNCG